jgi:hypothetical protein
MMEQIENFEKFTLNKTPVFPSVETNSNLWPDLLEDLLEKADMKSNVLSQNAQKIKTLVSRRNGIAHGETNFISEVDYYLTYESAVYEIMYDLALLVDDRLKREPYI